MINLNYLLSPNYLLDLFIIGENNYIMISSLFTTIFSINNFILRKSFFFETCSLKSYFRLMFAITQVFKYLRRYENSIYFEPSLFTGRLFSIQNLLYHPLPLSCCTTGHRRLLTESKLLVMLSVHSLGLLIQKQNYFYFVNFYILRPLFASQRRFVQQSSIEALCHPE